MVYQLFSSEQFPETLQTAKSYYQQQNQKFVHYLQKFSIPCATHYDGLNVWLSLPYADKMTQILRQRGWLVRSGQDFRVNQDISAIRVSTSDMTETQMQEFCQQLQQIYEVVVNF